MRTTVSAASWRELNVKGISAAPTREPNAKVVNTVNITAI
jgi:hypothetical protein